VEGGKQQSIPFGKKILSTKGHHVDKEMTERDLHHPIFFKKSGEFKGKNYYVRKKQSR
jgi:hypothetical protein